LASLTASLVDIDEDTQAPEEVRIIPSGDSTAVRCAVSLDESPSAVPLVLVPDAQPLDSLTPIERWLNAESGTSASPSRSGKPSRFTAAKSATKSYTQENITDSDADLNDAYVTNVCDMSCADILYTFLSHFTQRELQAVCRQVKVSKCGTKEKLKSCILRTVMSKLKKVVVGKISAHETDEERRDREIAEINKLFDVKCKTPSGLTRREHLSASFMECFLYCLSKRGDGPVILVRKCVIGNLDSARTGSSFHRKDLHTGVNGPDLHYDTGKTRAKDARNPFPTAEFRRLMGDLKDEGVTRAVVNSGQALSRRQLDSRLDPDQVWSDTVLPL
jgi:hypothetical protein